MKRNAHCAVAACAPASGRTARRPSQASAMPPSMTPMVAASSTVVLPSAIGAWVIE
ncbi:hypothetical protein [Castellaniella sp.]|uniref:hypothetical protein n=1 Tax=Castellaniella sp. TaxID=1955812 RepID=UPI002AFEEFCE|nr:hypothetical protein [Castellaniella sp.]